MRKRKFNKKILEKTFRLVQKKNPNNSKLFAQMLVQSLINNQKLKIFLLNNLNKVRNKMIWRTSETINPNTRTIQ